MNSWTFIMIQKIEILIVFYNRAWCLNLQSYTWEKTGELPWVDSSQPELQYKILSIVVIRHPNQLIEENI